MIEVRVQKEDFDVGREYDAVRQSANSAGAIVFFTGLVSELYTQGEPQEVVSHIELQHYDGMTESVCRDISEQARERFSLQAVRLVHRVGRLQAGEQIVFVATAARHRKAAFEGAQFVMDFLKTRATFWKKEVGSRGENWLGMKDNDALAAKRWQ